MRLKRGRETKYRGEDHERRFIDSLGLTSERAINDKCAWRNYLERTAGVGLWEVNYGCSAELAPETRAAVLDQRSNIISGSGPDL
jgi:hypothetical protein